MPASSTTRTPVNGPARRGGGVVRWPVAASWWPAVSLVELMGPSLTAEADSRSPNGALLSAR
ncbi:hypothetical protein GCM10010293_63710 [Streptomyces griseoflavus]|nr:hypothetical protein GCM10010293_63710 [Streptomyces griseoflavus]